MEILKKPLVTEKAMRLSELENKYTFIVSSTVNKLQIKEAVEQRYNVEVDSVNTLIYGVQRKAKYTKKGIQIARKSAYKKAVVKLVEGQSIDFYENK